MLLCLLDNAQRMHVVLTILCEDGLYSSMDSSLVARVDIPGNYWLVPVCCASQPLHGFISLCWTTGTSSNYTNNIYTEYYLCFTYIIKFDLHCVR